MADNQSQKSYGKSPIQPKTDHQLILSLGQIQPNSSSSPINMLNKFQVLGSPRPTYNSTLASPAPSPYHISNFPTANYVPKNITPRLTQHTQRPTQHAIQTSPYVQKAYTANLFHVKPCHSHLRNPLDIAKSFFPPKWNFIPTHPAKSVNFYRDILKHTESVTLVPIDYQFDLEKKNIAFHNCYIRKIISLRDWGRPFDLQFLPRHTKKFNYYDYIEAWTKVIFYQNNKDNHSWYFCFDNQFNSQLPSWFNRWWNAYDTIPEVLPPALMWILRINYKKTTRNKTNPL
jgi:hypothetical protein